MKRERISRRAVLRDAACGFGMLGLTSMLAEEGFAQQALRQPHHTPRAKRAIFLFMHGGPSGIDTFDPKPRLIRDDGKPLPFKQPLAFAPEQAGKLMRSPWEFKQHGQSGIWVSELFPHIAKCADDLCIVRSMVGDGVDHGGAVLQLHTGTVNFVRPSLGAWVMYGLGTENRNLPGFISMKPTLEHGGAKNWSSGFLPASYQGTAIGNSNTKVDEAQKEPIHYLKNAGLTLEQQRFELDMLQKLNQRHLRQRQFDSDLETRIGAYELAFKLQTEAPEAFDINSESEETKKLYGLDKEETRNFGWQCLLARRLAERGVRFIQCTDALPGVKLKWDQHTDLVGGHSTNARHVDQPIAALLKDLKSRGMLDDTLVFWGGEFGRTPIAQGRDGRDHNPYGYTIWLAGGGVKKGFVYGATDEIGYYAVEDPMHIHDLHATILHLLGLDHEKLTYAYSGRQFRLTDVHGKVAHKIIA